MTLEDLMLLAGVMVDALIAEKADSSNQSRQNKVEKSKSRQWISTSKRLPEMYKLVLVNTENNGISLGIYYPDDDEADGSNPYGNVDSQHSWVVACNRINTDEEFGGHLWCFFNAVTHWMPLPEAPKDE